MLRDYELLICAQCAREKVRPTDMTNVVRCFCGSDEFELYDLVAVARDPEERYALAIAPEEESSDAHDAVAC